MTDRSPHDEERLEIMRQDLEYARVIASVTQAVNGILTESERIVRLSQAQGRVFGSAKWWGFRSRWRVRRQALAAIRAALAGDPKPIEAFGIALSKKDGIPVLDQIERQSGRILEGSSVIPGESGPEFFIPKSDKS